ncbi:uncharacterized protein TRIADDRAFT_51773 [Trichoplax adhaerens]|uniref:G-protein coupled receptors family 3 profile domain-containing protein n=1 Tax=Trichoplax adhaerens TaxID=10228 RepID=B3RKU8_TRIAD|nr:hypothetical protein TRIADDRAFT_51773 [Trichoplax adhaerens]EDV28649.1 hypothetical protein TRIADDRAFT_51773 [Trichoplax adhaerens]|eukprot:XP_002107851.1 hypothetical protein TRIADDRAFT_51773 [Trichoplax adhaerens]
MKWTKYSRQHIMGNWWCIIMGIFLNCQFKNQQITVLSLHEDSLKSIYIGGSFSLDGDGTSVGDCLIATHFALEHINNNSNILQGYNLKLISGNARCNAGVGMKVLFHQLSTPPKKLMILGSACSTVTEPMAQTSREFDLVQISYASVSPALSNRKFYPNFFRTRSSENERIKPNFSILKRFNWKNIAVMVESINLYTSLADRIISIANSSGINIVVSYTFETNKDPLQGLSVIKKSSVRIIYTGFFPSPGRRLLCRAYHLGLTPPKYTWIGPGWFTQPYWWRGRDSGKVVIGNVECSDAVMDSMVEGFFSADPLPLSPNKLPTVSGLTPGEWIQDYDIYRQQPQFHEFLGGKKFAGFTYDATWVIALALNNSMQRLVENNKTLEEFDYNDKVYLDIFRSEMAKTKIDGVTGPIAFTEAGDRLGVAMLGRLEKGKNVEIGLYYTETDNVVWNNSVNISWGTNDGKPPIDLPAIKIHKDTVPLFLYITMVVLSGFGIALALFFMTFNMLYRNNRIIKVASPNINNIIAVSAIFCYLSIIFLGMNAESVGTNKILLRTACWARTWLLLLGFMTGFSALFTKTWRLQVIFSNRSAKSKVITNQQLYLFIAMIVLVGIVILTVQAVIDPIRIIERNTTEETSLNDDIIIIHNSITCSTNMPAVWQITMLGINGVLLAFGLSLAWRTRNIYITAANDSKYIGLAIYNVSVFAGTAVVVGLAIVKIKRQGLSISRIGTLENRPKSTIRSRGVTNTVQSQTGRSTEDIVKEKDDEIIELHKTIEELRASIEIIRSKAFDTRHEAIAIVGVSCSKL